MRITKRLAGAVAVAFALSGIAVSTTGCDKLFKDDESEEDDDDDDNDDDKDKEETETVAPVDAGPVAESDDVESYPEMTKAGGTFRLLKRFYVYRAADESSKKLTGLAPGTLVDFKFFYRDWIRIDWPSGPGELSPGWIHLRKQELSVHTKKAEKPDAGVEVVPDAGVEVVPDAGKDDEKKDDEKKDDEKKDAGTVKKADKPKLIKPRLKFKLPTKKK